MREVQNNNFSKKKYKLTCYYIGYARLQTKTFICLRCVKNLHCGLGAVHKTFVVKEEAVCPMRTSAHFVHVQKNTDFSKLGMSARTRGWASANKGGSGVNLSRFCTYVFHGRPLITMC